MNHTFVFSHDLSQGHWCYVNFSDNWRGWENCDVPLCKTAEKNNQENEKPFQTTKRIQKTSTKSVILTTKVEISSSISSTTTTTTRTTTTTTTKTTETTKPKTTISTKAVQKAKPGPKDLKDTLKSQICNYQRKICTHGKNALIKTIEHKSDCDCIETCRKTDGCKYVAILKTKCRLFKENCAPEKRRVPTKFVKIDECGETDSKKCKPKHKRCKNISGNKILI